jgi:hypothetical protein
MQIAISTNFAKPLILREANLRDQGVGGSNLSFTGDRLGASCSGQFTLSGHFTQVPAQGQMSAMGM